jgi:uncharacterized RDD family membrane protein YckC
VLAPGVQACQFCDSPEEFPLSGEAPSTEGNPTAKTSVPEQWRGELNQRLLAYRARRRKTFANEAQSALPFEERVPASSDKAGVQVEEHGADGSARDDFAFTIAIGRIAAKPEEQDPRLLIDVSVPPQTETPEAQAIGPVLEAHVSCAAFPVASLEDRKSALLIDVGCLAFAYGGFLALFGSLGGHFTLSKLSAAVCFFTFAFVYLQYFGLFTIFGGSTPGMLVCGLQVSSFTGDQPTPRQYLLRAVGYMLSAGTCFLGFLWVIWDEEALTWHDRISRTYLANIEALGEEDLSEVITAR